MNVLEQIRRRFSDSLARLTDRAEEYSALVRPAQDAKFGDYQANCAMPLGKEIGGKPREIAQKIIDGLPETDIFSSIEIAGPGFINLRLRDDFLCQQLAAQLRDAHCGIESRGSGTVMVIDFSSPNVAKPMHVGHLRSTIIGDALARICRALSWNVITDNHLGDWGTQFGMLIYGWKNPVLKAKAQQLASSDVEVLMHLYLEVNRQAERDAEVATQARLETAKLHEGDEENLALWNRFMPWCLEDLERIYRRLDIRFDHHFGESYYQPLLGKTVDDLREANLAVDSEGAACIFFFDPTEKTDEDGNPLQRMPPAIVQKGDGAYTYATSDLACIRDRIDRLGAGVIVYVVDDRQSLHFQQLFDAARRWDCGDCELVHVAFGKITDSKGRPYKTREGGTVGLADLLDEAVLRAKKVVDEVSPQLSEEERAAIAEAVGLGAVKYADLSQNRTSDYVFDWDKMISLDGNTATYLQYVYARNRSIFRKGEIDPVALSKQPLEIRLEHPSERALAVSVLRYSESLEQAARDYKPNLLTNYLFDLANVYNAFFRDCPVLKAGSDASRNSRLALCELTARTIQHGLGLLGIRTVERM